MRNLRLRELPFHDSYQVEELGVKPWPSYFNVVLREPLYVLGTPGP